MDANCHDRPEGYIVFLKQFQKMAGALGPLPDATGPYGRGMGPGAGTQSGLGLLMRKLQTGEKLTPEEQQILSMLAIAYLPKTEGDAASDPTMEVKESSYNHAINKYSGLLGA